MTTRTAAKTSTISQPTMSRPFSLTVAPPSGRRPRPIEGRGTKRHSRLDRLHRVTYHYEVDYLRPGRKTSTRVWIREHGFISVDTAKRSETTPAYKITWRDKNRPPTDIVEFRNGLWWSIDMAMPADRFFSALAAGEPSAVGLLGGSLLPTGKRMTTRDRLHGCKIVKDSQVDAECSLHRGSRELLVIDDRVFIQDGEPIYVLWNHHIDPKLTIRASHEFVEAIRGSDVDPGYDDLTNALTFGHVFASCELKEVSAFFPNAKIARHATMQILVPRKFASEPLEVQTAAFRKLLHLATVPRRLPRVAATEMQEKLSELRDSVGALSTLVRARAIEHYLAWMDTFPWASSIWVEQRFVRHVIDHVISEGLRRDANTPFSKPVLCEEDAVKLAAISNLWFY